VVLNLPTDQHQPFLGTVGAKLGLREVGLETAEIILDFDPPPIEVLFRSGLRPPNPVVSLNLDLLDSRISLDLRARNPLVGLNLDLLDARVGLDLHLIACLHEFVLQAIHAILSFDFHMGDALVRLSLRPDDAGVGVRLQLGESSFRSPSATGR
jgi:hypothetical protein